MNDVRARHQRAHRRPAARRPAALRRLAPLAALAVATTVLASGCFFLPSAVRNVTGPPQARPWWCTADGGSDLSVDDCKLLSAELDVALVAAQEHWQASAAIAEGASPTAYTTGRGAAFAVESPTASFDPAAPDTYLYDGTAPTARIVGLEWNVTSVGAPEGFPGTNDTWTPGGGGTWTLRAWLVRPFENQPSVFAPTHPCLTGGGAVYDTTAPCYAQSHPRPLQIVVTNDDGYNAVGIDHAVEALKVVPGVEVTVVAPATNQSGSGDKTTPSGLTTSVGTTLSGHPATIVNGYPADSVNYALHSMRLNPDLVVSGINFGQNLGPAVPLSGTIGAARVAARSGIPTVAASQGYAASPNFPAGASALVSWLDDFRLGRTGPPAQVVANLNVPTCATGTIRGTAVLPASTALNGRPYDPSNCTSTATAFADDLDGFLAGFTVLSDVGL